MKLPEERFLNTLIDCTRVRSSRWTWWACTWQWLAILRAQDPNSQRQIKPRPINQRNPQKHYRAHFPCLGELSMPCLTSVSLSPSEPEKTTQGKTSGNAPREWQLILAEWVKEHRERWKYLVFLNCELNPRGFNIYTDSAKSLALPRHDHEVASILNWVPKACAVEGWIFIKKKKFFVPGGLTLATCKQEVQAFKALVNLALFNFTEGDQIVKGRLLLGFLCLQHLQAMPHVGYRGLE